MRTNGFYPNVTSVQNFTEIVPGNPSIGGVKRNRGIATYVTFGYLCRRSWTSCITSQQVTDTNVQWQLLMAKSVRILKIREQKTGQKIRAG